MEAHSENRSIEQLVPGLTVEWVDNRRIAIYTFKSLTRSSVPTWMDHFRKLIQTWPADRPCLVLQDVSEKNLGIPPYIRQQSNELSKIRPELPGAVAIILPDKFFLQLIATYTRLQRKEEREIKVFFTRDESLTWLRTKK